MCNGDEQLNLNEGRSESIDGHASEESPVNHWNWILVLIEIAG